MIEVGSGDGAFASPGAWLTGRMGEVPAPFLPFRAGSAQAKGSVGFTLVSCGSSDQETSVKGMVLPLIVVPRWMVPERKGPMPNTKASLACEENC